LSLVVCLGPLSRQCSGSYFTGEKDLASFYSRLSYSFGNEDWKTEAQALKIQPQDTVLCVTASGDRPLHLLLSECRRLISVDANPLQNALLELKKAALDSLSFEDYLAFLGATPCKHREELLLRIGLPTPFSSGMIRKGILYQGTTERLCNSLAKILSVTRGSKIEQLFKFDSVEDQKIFLKEQWNTFLWEKTFYYALHPKLTRFVIKDPGLYAYVDPEIHPGIYVRQRMNSHLEHFLAKDNYFLSLILKGAVDPAAFPPYLTEGGAEAIRPRLSRLTTQTIDLVSYLKQAPTESIDCFSLSDVASYISDADFVVLLKELCRTAKPGARFSIRQFMSRRTIPQELASRFKRDLPLEKELEHQDNCFVYHFTVGKVVR